MQTIFSYLFFVNVICLSFSSILRKNMQRIPSLVQSLSRYLRGSNSTRSVSSDYMHIQLDPTTRRSPTLERKKKRRASVLCLQAKKGNTFCQPSYSVSASIKSWLAPSGNDDHLPWVPEGIRRVDSLSLQKNRNYISVSHNWPFLADLQKFCFLKFQ